MQLPRFLSFSGTDSKADWWSTTIVCLIIDAMAVAGGLIAAFNLSSPLNYLVSSLAIFVLFLTLWATFAVSSRRFRDLGYSPWLTLLYLIPYIGWLLVWIPCGFLPFKTSKRMKVRRRTVSSSSP